MDTWIVWIQIKILPTPLTWILSQTTPYKILLRHLGNSDYKLYIREYEENSLSFVRCANTIVILYRKMTTFLETHNKVRGMKCHSGTGLLSDISVGGREKRMHGANVVKAWNYWWIDNSSLYYSSTFENVRVFHNYFFKTWLPFDDLHKAQNSTLNTEDWAKLCWEYPSGSERLTRLSSKVCPRLPLHPAAFLHICSNPAIPQTHLVPQRDHAPSCPPTSLCIFYTLTWWVSSITCLNAIYPSGLPPKCSSSVQSSVRTSLTPSAVQNGRSFSGAPTVPVHMIITVCITRYWNYLSSCLISPPG